MQTLSLSQFKRLTAVDYSHQHGTICIESFGRIVGYFVPPAIWAETSTLADLWAKEFTDAMVPPAQDAPDA